MKKVAHACYMI